MWQWLDCIYIIDLNLIFTSHVFTLRWRPLGTMAPITTLWLWQDHSVSPARTNLPLGHTHLLAFSSMLMSSEGNLQSTGRGIKSWASLRMTPLSLQSWSQPGWTGPQLPTTSLYLCSVPIFIVFLGNSHMGPGWNKRSLSNLSMKLPVSFFLITDNLLIDLTPSQFNFFLSHTPNHPSPQCPMTSKKNLSSKHSHYPAKIILTSPLEFI